jgi:hypothetical protein
MVNLDQAGWFKKMLHLLLELDFLTGYRPFQTNYARESKVELVK